jgi:Fe2+ or Zn2+ uptake regulation protein
LICVNCGKVRDISADFSQIEVPEEHRRGFVLRTTEVTFRGLCDQCARENASEP